jgi:hypothetical protein
MGYSANVLYFPTATGINQAVSALGKIMCFNPSPAPTGVQCNDYTLGNPVLQLDVRCSGLFHPTQLYYGQP